MEKQNIFDNISDDMITIKEFAELKGIKYDTLRQQVHRGQYKTAVVIGNMTYINKNDVAQRKNAKLPKKQQVPDRNNVYVWSELSKIGTPEFVSLNAFAAVHNLSPKQVLSRLNYIRSTGEYTVKEKWALAAVYDETKKIYTLPGNSSYATSKNGKMIKMPLWQDSIIYLNEAQKLSPYLSKSFIQQARGYSSGERRKKTEFNKFINTLICVKTSCPIPIDLYLELHPNRTLYGIIENAVNHNDGRDNFFIYDGVFYIQSRYIVQDNQPVSYTFSQQCLPRYIQELQQQIKTSAQNLNYIKLLIAIANINLNKTVSLNTYASYQGVTSSAVRGYIQRNFAQQTCNDSSNQTPYKLGSQWFIPAGMPYIDNRATDGKYVGIRKKKTTIKATTPAKTNEPRTQKSGSQGQLETWEQLSLFDIMS